MEETDQLNVDELAEAVARKAAGRPRILIGIDGPGASGKSTLASLLVNRLSKAEIVQVDDFYLPTPMRASRVGEVGARFDLPRLAEHVVRPAASGRGLRYQRYDWDRDSLWDWIELPADVPVIVEGVYCLQLDLRPPYTYTIFCQGDSEVRLRRGLERDGEEARALWVDEWMPEEDRYVSAEHPDDFATLLVDSSLGSVGGSVGYHVRRWDDR